MNSHFRCVIVEDDETSMKYLKSLLERLGFYVCIAWSGEEAFSTLEKNEIDIIFLDIMMPGMDGMEVTTRIRNSKKPYKDVPIVAVTSLDDPCIRKRCVDAGVSAYICKPFGSYEMAECIGNICNKHNLYSYMNDFD